MHSTSTAGLDRTCGMVCLPKWILVRRKRVRGRQMGSEKGKRNIFNIIKKEERDFMELRTFALCNEQRNFPVPTRPCMHTSWVHTCQYGPFNLSGSLLFHSPLFNLFNWAQYSLPHPSLPPPLYIFSCSLSQYNRKVPHVQLLRQHKFSR